MAIEIVNPIKVYTSSQDGQPIKDGYLFIGEYGLDAQANPVAVYYDYAMTIPASQPIRIRDGQVKYNGASAHIYTADNYSVKIKDKNGITLYNNTTIENTAETLRADLDNDTDPAKGAGLVGYKGRTQSDKNDDVLSIWDGFGIVGDGVADDYSAFVLACNAAKSRNKPLNLYDAKIYLGSQSAPIDSDGLVLIGAGNIRFLDMPVSWDLETGTGGITTFINYKAKLNATSGAVIYSAYNGEVFTGKTFSGSGFTLIGYPIAANSCGFKQTTPTAYPGWSQPFKDLHDVTINYFGKCCLWALGGSEVYTMERVEVGHANEYSLLIQQTAGINCPIEYFTVKGGSAVSGLLGNIYIEGVSKQVKIDNVCLNSPGQLGRRNAGGYVVSTDADIVYPIVIRPAIGSLIVAAVDTQVVNCYAEETQAIVKFAGALSGFPLFNVVKVIDNYVILMNTAWPHIEANFADTIYYNVQTSGNTTPVGVRFKIVSSTGHTAIDFQEEFSGNTFTLDGSLKDSQRVPLREYAQDSGTFGNGSTGYFSINGFADMFATPADKAAVPELLLVTASYKNNTANTFGAYLLTCVRMPNGETFSTAMPFGSVSGFVSPPSMLTNGVVLVELAANYYGRVTRIGNNALNPSVY